MAQMQASQSYIYKLESYQLNKYFDENPTRLFYKLNFSDVQKSATGDHLCISDKYYAEYKFLSPEQFNLKYIVKGPEKNFDIVTSLRKV